MLERSRYLHLWLLYDRFDTVKSAKRGGTSRQGPTPKGSPCTVARETPWRGCASDSLGPAVDTGDEGGWALRECKNPRQNLSPVTFTAADIPLFIPNVNTPYTDIHGYVQRGSIKKKKTLNG